MLIYTDTHLSLKLPEEFLKYTTSQKEKLISPSMIAEILDLRPEPTSLQNEGINLRLRPVLALSIKTDGLNKGEEKKKKTKERRKRVGKI